MVDETWLVWAMALKALPGDFVVTERLRDLPGRISRGGPYAVFSLRKAKVNTATATSELARALNVPASRAAAAGLKDRYAVTTQYVTVDLRADATPPTEVILRSRLPPSGAVSGRGWRAHLVGWTDRPLASTDLDGNRFEITLRRLTPTDNAELDRRLALLITPAATPPSGGPTINATGAPSAGNTITWARPGSPGATLWFVNYFGPQRFGSIRHSLGFSAPLLLRGEFEEAVRRELAVPTSQDGPTERRMRQHLRDHWGRWQDCLRSMPPRTPYRAAVAALARPGGTFKQAFLALPEVPRSMTVLAFQAHLWNELAVALTRYLRLASGTAAALRTRIQTTGLAIETLAARDLARTVGTGQQCRLLNCTLPLLGPKTALDSDAWSCGGGFGTADFRQIVGDILAQHGVGAASPELALARLRIPGVRRPFFATGARPWLACATEVVMTAPELDDHAPARKQVHPKQPPLTRRTVAFNLPAGAYATVLIGFLLPPNLAAPDPCFDNNSTNTVAALAGQAQFMYRTRRPCEQCPLKRP